MNIVSMELGVAVAVSQLPVCHAGILGPFKLPSRLIIILISFFMARELKKIEIYNLIPEYYHY